MRKRTLYQPIEQAHAGMELALPVTDRYHMTLLPAGSHLTEENLAQLLAHEVELVCIAVEDTRSAEEIGLHAAHSARQVLEVFESADLDQPALAALFNQVIIYRSA